MRGYCCCQGCGHGYSGHGYSHSHGNGNGRSPTQSRAWSILFLFTDSPLLIISVHVAEWLEHLTGHQKVTGCTHM